MGGKEEQFVPHRIRGAIHSSHRLRRTRSNSDRSELLLDIFPYRCSNAGSMVLRYGRCPGRKAGQRQ